MIVGGKIAADRAEVSDLRERDFAKNKSQAVFDDANGDFFAADEEMRRVARQLYRKLDKTEEWAENHYYHLPLQQQVGNLITVNAFWRDYAQHDHTSPFLSTNQFSILSPIISEPIEKHLPVHLSTPSSPFPNASLSTHPPI